MNKPPVGITPAFLYWEARLQEIDEAIKRHLVTYHRIPKEWMEERNDVIAMIEKYKKGSH